MQPFAPNAVLWIGLSLGIGAPAAASIPPPDSPLALQEAKQLDRLPPVAPWGKAPIDHSGRKQTGHASAQELEMSKHGVSLVEVKPIVVPQPNGEVKLGAGAANLTPQEIHEVSRVGTIR